MKKLLVALLVFGTTAEASALTYDNAPANIHITLPEGWQGPSQLNLSKLFHGPNGQGLTISVFPGDIRSPGAREGLLSTLPAQNRVSPPVSTAGKDREIVCTASKADVKGDGNIISMYVCGVINKSHAYMVGFIGPEKITSIDNPIYVGVLNKMLGLP